MSVPVRFAFVDVFAANPLSGAPLPVVPDADGLSEFQMKAIAWEFQHSETTFIVRPTLPEATWRLRSFTSSGVEVGGAGHNALGAWLWLAESGALSGIPAGTQLAQEIGGEVLPVEVSTVDGRPVVSMDQGAPSVGAVVEDYAGLAAALGLAETDLDSEHRAQAVSTGVSHLMVGALDRYAVDRAAPDTGRLAAVLHDHAAEGCYLYSLDPVIPGAVAYARFFNPTIGIAEDPATGTAAGPLMTRLVASGQAAAGVANVIEQGTAMGRPSEVRVTVTGDRVQISGSGVVVAEGTLRL